jgi:hypothetical protein
MQRDWKRGYLSFLHRPNLEPGRKRQHPSAHSLRRFRIYQFLLHRDGHKHLLKQLSEQVFLFDGDQIPEWGSVGNSFHPASMLTRVAARRRFEQRRLPVQIRPADRSQGDTDASPENLPSRPAKDPASPKLDRASKSGRGSPLERRLPRARRDTSPPAAASRLATSSGMCSVTSMCVSLARECCECGLPTIRE